MAPIGPRHELIDHGSKIRKMGYDKITQRFQIVGLTERNLHQDKRALD